MNKRAWAQWLVACSGNRKSKTSGERSRTIKNPKWWGIIAIVFTFIFGAVVAEAQQPKNIPRIGVIRPGSSAGPILDSFRQGLRELGYLDGKNIIIEYRYAEGKLDRLPDLVAAIVRLKPDVIVVGSTRVAEAAKQATSTIPIVVFGGDIVGAGLVSSLARPGGNVTGLTSISPDLSGKRLELLKDAVPKVSRVGVLWYPGRDEDEVKQTEIAGRAFGIAIQSVQVQSVKGFDSAYAAMKRERANGIILIQGGFTLFHRKQLAELAAKNRLASMCEQSTWTDDGCLMSYGPSQTDRMRRAATYVDKILKGAKPADLPVEQPTKFELVINLKTANQIGLTIPQKVLARADRVIK
jgi:putative ABC transport system substrate-binding protein